MNTRKSLTVLNLTQIRWTHGKSASPHTRSPQNISRSPLEHPKMTGKRPQITQERPWITPELPQINPWPSQFNPFIVIFCYFVLMEYVAQTLPKAQRTQRFRAWFGHIPAEWSGDILGVIFGDLRAFWGNLGIVIGESTFSLCYSQVV